MEHLGFWGIIKLTLQIILRNLKHFLCIGFLLTLPSALIFFIFGPSTLQWIRALVASISLLHKLISDSHNITPDEEALIITQQKYGHSLPLIIVIYIVSVIIALLGTILVTFSVCRACMNKSVDLKGSLRGARKSAMNLVVTVLVAVGVVVAVSVVGMVGMMIVVVAVMAMNAKMAVVAMIIMGVGVIGGEMYVAVALGLADIVAIVEEKRGWEALRRSMYLIRGSMWLALGLSCFYELVAVASLFVCASDNAFVVWRWVVGAISVALQSLIALCSIVSHVVLYMSCKSGHAEPFDSLLPASAKFGSQPLASYYLDLETAAFTTSTP